MINIQRRILSEFKGKRKKNQTKEPQKTFWKLVTSKSHKCARDERCSCWAGHRSVFPLHSDWAHSSANTDVSASSEQQNRVLLPDFCTGKTLWRWLNLQLSLSPVSGFTDSTSGNRRKLPQEGKLTLWCCHSWLAVLWSRRHQGTPRLTHAESGRAATPDLYQKHHLAAILFWRARPLSNKILYKSQVRIFI